MHIERDPYYQGIPSEYENRAARHAWGMIVLIVVTAITGAVFALAEEYRVASAILLVLVYETVAAFGHQTLFRAYRPELKALDNAASHLKNVPHR